MNSRSTRASEDLSSLTVQQIVASRGFGRGSRSPSPAPTAYREFFPDNNNPYIMGDQEIPEEATPAEVRQMALQARLDAQRARDQADRLTSALEAATAAIQALGLNAGAQRANATQPQRRKRPDLPAFDKQNIHIWVQRVEAAYAREQVVDPKQKFAFLESVIGVNMGPTINGFMFGVANEDNWKRFIAHLLETFGPTKEQRCSTYLDGVKRDGRRPSDLLALIRDNGKDVTIDDLQKQLILRELPSDMRKLLQDKIEGKNAEEVAALADAHFDREGRPLNNGATISSINTTDQASAAWADNQSTVDAPTSDYPDVNAINNHRPRGQQRGGRGNNSNNSRFTAAFPSSSSRPGRSSSRPRQRHPSNPPTSANGQQSEYSICRLHNCDPNSTVCQGPRCPSHHKASSCLAPSCNTHAGKGNGRGGRR